MLLNQFVKKLHRNNIEFDGRGKIGFSLIIHSWTKVHLSQFNLCTLNGNLIRKYYADASVTNEIIIYHVQTYLMKHIMIG